MKFVTKLIASASILALSGTIAHADEIKVGSVAGITGPIAELIVPIVGGRNLAAKHVNAQGGLLGGDTYTLIQVDSACDPKNAVDAGKKVVDVNQVVAVVGASCSGATSALASSVTVPAGVTQISDSATAPGITSLDDKGLLFRVAPSDAYQGLALAKLVIADGIKNIAVTYASDDYNVGLANVFVSEFEKAGGKVVANQVHEPKKASYRSELATLAGANADALIVFSYYGSGGITILKNSLENGLFDKFYAADGMLDKSVIEQIGADNLKGRIKITQSAADVNAESYKKFVELFKETGLDPASPYAAHGYDASFMMALAIEKAGSADRSKIAAALTKIDDGSQDSTIIRPGEWEKAKMLIKEGKPINYEGASGSVDFDENGDVAGVYSVSIIDDEGKWAGTLLK
jgi:branched-chain amino acid transport system substrate-binding protein